MNEIYWIDRLTSGNLVRQTVTVDARPRGSSDAWTSLPVSSAPVVLDEATSPYAAARLELSGPVPPAILDPTGQLWTVRVRLGFACDTLTEDQQVAYLVITDIEESNGRTTLVCASDEDLLSRAVFPPQLAETACPQNIGIGLIWAAISPKLSHAAPLTVTDLSEIPTTQRSLVWAMPYGGGDKPLDYLRALADTAGLWLHSDQSPESTGGLIVEVRRTPTASNALDLRSTITAPLVIEQSVTRGLSGDYASAILLTCTWPEGTGRAQSSGLIPAAGVERTPAVKPISLDMRPPTAYRTRLSAAWPTAQALANRQAQRTWEATLVIPGLPWIVPGTPVLTDWGLGLIKTAALNPALGTSTISVRPA